MKRTFLSGKSVEKEKLLKSETLTRAAVMIFLIFMMTCFYPNLYSPVRMLAITPPSMSKSVPVMNFACSPSRKAAASAISSLVPVRLAAEASIMA